MNLMNIQGGVVCTIKRLAGKVRWNPVEPQPAKEDLITLCHYYASLVFNNIPQACNMVGRSARTSSGWVCSWTASNAGPTRHASLRPWAFCQNKTRQSLIRCASGASNVYDQQQAVDDSSDVPRITSTINRSSGYWNQQEPHRRCTGSYE